METMFLCLMHKHKKRERLDKPKQYLGNGKVFWNNGSIVNAEKEAQPTEVSAEGDLF